MGSSYGDVGASGTLARKGFHCMLKTGIQIPIVVEEEI